MYQEFGPIDAKCKEYLKENRDAIVPKINERIKAENSYKK